MNDERDGISLAAWAFTPLIIVLLVFLPFKAYSRLLTDLLYLDSVSLCAFLLVVASIVLFTGIISKSASRRFVCYQFAFAFVVLAIQTIYPLF